MKRLTLALLVALPTVAFAQQTPRIAAVFPAGARTGQSVEVSIRGGNLDAARKLLVLGAPGVAAELVGVGGKVDNAARPVFQARCTTCHEARSPDNRTLGPEQWAQVTDRMIKVRGADIPPADRDRIVAFLQGMARAGVVTARMTIARDAPAGVREVRLVTAMGVSAGFRFEVGALPEVAAAGDTQPVTLPVVANGALTLSGQKDRFTFAAHKGERLTFNLKGFRLNEQSVAFFNPSLFLDDSRGKTVAKSLGRFGLDPLIEWSCPADGEYTLTVRDLLWKGNPASIYRLAMGAIPYETVLSPMVGRPGQPLETTILGGAGSPDIPLKLRVPADTTGVSQVATPVGEAPLLVREIPDGGGAVSSVELAEAITLPAAFSGRISRPGEQVDRFRVRALAPSGLELYCRRLGSGLRPTITVKTRKGDVVATRTVADDNDPVIGDAFRTPGEYVVEVSASTEQGGAYCWEATGGKVPDFTLTATPDGVNLAPGHTGALLVRATRRDGIPGPITVGVRNAPKWLSVTPAVIPPDDDKAVLLLSVADNAPVDGGEIVLEGRTEIPDERNPDETHPLVRRVRPIELYRNLNNTIRSVERQAAYVGVTAEPAPFSLVLYDETTLTLKPGQEVTARVRVLRRAGFRGDVFVQLQGLPPGIQPIPFQVQVPPGQSEASFTLRATPGARFLESRPDDDLPPMRFVFVGTTGGLDAIAPFHASAPVALVGPKTRVELEKKPKKKGR